MRRTTTFFIAFLLLFSINTYAQLALDFDGDDDYADNNATLGQNDNFTLEAYVQYRPYLDFYQTIMGFGSAVEMKAVNGQIAYIVNNGGNGVLLTPFSMVNGQWYHFALVRRMGVWELYIDGVSQNITQNAAPTIDPWHQFWMGGRSNGECWNGVLDEIRVWTVARTEVEIQANMGSCLKGNESGLYLYYPPNETAGNTTIVDKSGNGFNGMLNQMDPSTDWVAGGALTCDYCSTEMTVTPTINLVPTPAPGTDTQTACSAYTWIDGNVYVQSNTTATYTLQTASGCDSTVTLNLTMLPPLSGVDHKTACDMYTWIDGNTYNQNNTTATYMLQTSGGRDSIVTLDLVINHPVTSTDYKTACGSYTWSNGVTYTASTTTPSQLLSTVAGCDSLVLLDLTIISLNMATYQSGTVLLSEEINGDYQWIRCGDDSPVAGADDRVFLADQNGSYAVIVTVNGCSDTSACMNVTTVGINTLEGNSFISVYPNPNMGSFNIESESAGSIELVNAAGQIILARNVEAGKNALELENIAGGIYTIHFLEKEAGLTSIHRISIVK